MNTYTGCIVCRRDCGAEHFQCQRATDWAKQANMDTPRWCPSCFQETACGIGTDKWHGPACRSRCSIWHSAAKDVPVPDVLGEIAAERKRYLVVQREERTIKSDDAFTKGELARQAASYAMWASGHDYLFATLSNDSNPERGHGANCGHVSASNVLWPFYTRDTSNRPTLKSYDGGFLTKREALVRAGALIVGEIERLDRAAGDCAEGVAMTVTPTMTAVPLSVAEIEGVVNSHLIRLSKEVYEAGQVPSTSADTIQARLQGAKVAMARLDVLFAALADARRNT